MAKCPYCKMEANFKNVVKETRGVGIFMQEIIYSCPHCQSILGFSRGKFG